MTTLVDIAVVEQFAPGAVMAATVGAIAVAVFDVEGLLYAVTDACLGCGAPVSKGKREGRLVTCRECGWQYDVVTGCVSGLPALRIDRFAVKIVDARIVLELSPLPNT